MEATQTYTEPTNAETIWAILREVTEQQKENEQRMKETDRQMKETDRLIKENAEQQKKSEREMKASARRLDKQLGKLGGRFGEMVEYMVAPNLLKKFGKLGLVFDKVYHQATIKDIKNNIITEIDITLENGDKVMIVEVKSKPNTGDITEHIERMEKVRAYADLHNDRRKFLGAIAGMVINDNERDFALKNGFYVIEPSGETFTIIAPEGDYSPREW